MYETLVHQHTFSVCVSDLICHTSINNITVMLGIYVVNVQVLYLTLSDIFQIFEKYVRKKSLIYSGYKKKCKLLKDSPRGLKMAIAKTFSFISFSTI